MHFTIGNILIVGYLLCTGRIYDGALGCGSKRISCLNENTYKFCFTIGNRVIKISNVKHCPNGTMCSETEGYFPCLTTTKNHDHQVQPTATELSVNSTEDIFNTSTIESTFDLINVPADAAEHALISTTISTELFTSTARGEITTFNPVNSERNISTIPIIDDKIIKSTTSRMPSKPSTSSTQDLMMLILTPSMGGFTSVIPLETNENLNTYYTSSMVTSEATMMKTTIYSMTNVKEITSIKPNEIRTPPPVTGFTVPESTIIKITTHKIADEEEMIVVMPDETVPPIIFDIPETSTQLSNARPPTAVTKLSSSIIPKTENAFTLKETTTRVGSGPPVLTTNNELMSNNAVPCKNDDPATTTKANSTVKLNTLSAPIISTSTTTTSSTQATPLSTLENPASTSNIQTATPSNFKIFASSTITPTTAIPSRCASTGRYPSALCNQYYECVKVMWWYQMKLTSCRVGERFDATQLLCVPDKSCISTYLFKALTKWPNYS